MDKVSSLLFGPFNDDTTSIHVKTHRNVALRVIPADKSRFSSKKFCLVLGPDQLFSLMGLLNTKVTIPSPVS